MMFCMHVTNGHQWKNHPHPLPKAVVNELYHLLYLEQVGGHINEVWTCADSTTGVKRSALCNRPRPRR